MVFMVINVSFSRPIEDGLLLLNVHLTGEIQALVHSDVHLLNENTVCRYSITLLDINNISNNKVSNLNRAAGSESSSVNCNSLVVDLIPELEVLSLLDVVTGCRDQGSEQESTEDGQSLNIGSCTWTEN